MPLVQLNHEYRPWHTFVLEIIDGDTIVGSNQVRYRLKGIDANEGTFPFAKEAGRLLMDLIYEQSVYLLYDLFDSHINWMDTYERILVYIYRATDLLDVCRVMVEQGFAKASNYPGERIQEFHELECAARAAKCGMWSYNMPSYFDGTPSLRDHVRDMQPRTVLKSRVKHRDQLPIWVLQRLGVGLTEPCPGEVGVTQELGIINQPKELVKFSDLIPQTPLVLFPPWLKNHVVPPSIE